MIHTTVKLVYVILGMYTNDNDWLTYYLILGWMLCAYQLLLAEANEES